MGLITMSNDSVEITVDLPEVAGFYLAREAANLLNDIYKYKPRPDQSHTYQNLIDWCADLAAINGVLRYMGHAQVAPFNGPTK